VTSTRQQSKRGQRGTIWEWIEHNILLELAIAPFSKEDAALLPEDGACVNCPKHVVIATFSNAEQAFLLRTAAESRTLRPP